MDEVLLVQKNMGLLFDTQKAASLLLQSGLLLTGASFVEAASLAKPIAPTSNFYPSKIKAPDINLAPRTVVIPAGCFQMGSPEQEQDRNTDEIQHRVCVKTFKLTQHEVTQAVFRQFVNLTGYVTDAERNVEEAGCWTYHKDVEQNWDWWPNGSWREPVSNTEKPTELQPVSCVSFNDITAFIHWLNQRTGQEYRLPTEAEWEFAARANTITSRYWGNGANSTCSYENVADKGLPGQATKWPQAHDCVDGHFFAATVKNYHANQFGLFDMLGNVSEWTCSMYSEQYSGAESQCEEEANAPDRPIAIRGGGWHADPARVRAAFRNTGLAWFRQANLGFRLVRVR